MGVRQRGSIWRERLTLDDSGLPGEPIVVEAVALIPPHPALSLTSVPIFPLTLQPGVPISVGVRYAPTAAGTA